MSSSYLMSMPILIYNLGIEMVYVLCSRLKAQNIPEDKSTQVIRDIVSNLFEKKFINEIQKKQEIAKHLSVRQLFDKLIHSSIMRLNTNSMNKLYDLILMSIKLQLIKTKFAEEIFQITMNHFNALLDILNKSDAKANQDVINLIKENIDYVNKTYMSMNPYDYIILKQTLLRFFQGKNVKVSIFIQDGWQSNTGVIYLNMNETAPPQVKKPGHIVKYNLNGGVIKEFHLKMKLSNIYEMNKNVERVNIFTTELGGNIYLDERRVKEDYTPTNTIDTHRLSNPPGRISNLESEHPFDKTNSFDNNKKIKDDVVNNSNVFNNYTPNPNNPNNPNYNSINKTYVNSSNLSQDAKSNNNNILNKNSSNYLNDTKQRQDNIDNVKKEFGHLADLLNVNNKDETQFFKLDLFKPSGRINHKNNTDDDDFIEIEREKVDKMDKIKGIFDDFNINYEDKDSDDLLELMDLAAQK